MSSSSIISIGDANYIVIRTKYTSRLLSEQIRYGLDYTVGDCKLVCLRDALWGPVTLEERKCEQQHQDLWTAVDIAKAWIDPEDKDALALLDLSKENSETSRKIHEAISGICEDGYVVYTGGDVGRAVELTKALKACDYCGWGNLIDVIHLVKNEELGDIMVIECETESG